MNLSPVLTLFFVPSLPGQTWAALWASPKFIRISHEGYTLPSGNDQFDKVARQEKWLSTLNNSDGISGTTLTSLQPEEWITSKVPTLSPHSTNKEVPEFSHPGPSLPIQALPFGSVRRSNYGITKYHNPPARLVGQCQCPPNLSPIYTISSSSVSGVSFND